ncbi:hypothetical protein ACL9RM_20940 [Paenibacillus sp. S29]
MHQTPGTFTVPTQPAMPIPQFPYGSSGGHQTPGTFTVPTQPAMPIPQLPYGSSGGLNSGNMTTILGQFQRPTEQPPAQMLSLYQQLKANPTLLKKVIQMRPQNIQQALEIVQSDGSSQGGVYVHSTPRSRAVEDYDYRPLPGFCYFKYSLIFTWTDVFLMWPVTNIFGFVVGYCFFTPCAVPDNQIIFALC